MWSLGTRTSYDPSAVMQPRLSMSPGQSACQYHHSVSCLRPPLVNMLRSHIHTYILHIPHILGPETTHRMLLKTKLPTSMSDSHRQNSCFDLGSTTYARPTSQPFCSPAISMATKIRQGHVYSL